MPIDNINYVIVMKLTKLFQKIVTALRLQISIDIVTKTTDEYAVE